MRSRTQRPNMKKNQYNASDSTARLDDPEPPAPQQPVQDNDASFDFSSSAKPAEWKTLEEACDDE